MNPQKAVTTLAQNHVEEVIKIRLCSEPNQKVIQLYDALKKIRTVQKENICSTQIRT
ncbi:MAG: hypothetical protein PHS59_11115 [Paludibacter sp.]|nr:hypothetical protein [Paludibacter sp.]